MGIDPGITRCGIAVIDVDESRQVKLVDVRVARSPQTLATHFRVCKIADEIDAEITRYDPDVVAIERVFAQDNLQSVTTTMQIMGAAMVCVGRAKKPMAVHTPSEVKAAITGSGTAGKSQVQHMVQRILRMRQVIRPADAADAVAIAICHGWRGSGLLGASEDGTVTISLSGAIRAKGQLTAAQQQWTAAAAKARQTGAVDPRRRR